MKIDDKRLIQLYRTAFLCRIQSPSITLSCDDVFNICEDLLIKRGLSGVLVENNVSLSPPPSKDVCDNV